MKPPLRGLGLAAALIAGWACTAPATPSPIAPSASSAARTASGIATPVPTGPGVSAGPTATATAIERRIGVRVVDGAGEFYDRQTGVTFVPRGFNWVRLAGGRHAAFDEGVYDPQQVDAEFERMASAGYNTVRVFMSTYEGGVLGTDSPLSSPYLDRVADFLARAAAHGLYALLTQDELGPTRHYGFESDPGIENINAVYLSRGGVDTDVRYFGDLVRELASRGARLDTLLAYEIRNELYFTNKYPPFSMSSGEVTTANGLTYDMASADDQARMLEDNLLHWIDRSRSAILAVDPTALVTVGFFQPQGPVPSRIGDDRLIETRRAIVESSADFIDLHGYPGGELNLQDIVTNFKLPPVTEKPILLGEFGAEHFAYATVDDAVRALVNWQIESCSYGFDGWLTWLWDSTDQPEFWGGRDEGGQIAEVMAPGVRPDACTYGPLDIATDLTRGATAKASSSVPDFPPAKAIDGLADTYWNSAAGPPQWIQLDLGGARTIDEFRLSVAQDPAGASRHVLSVRAAGGQWRQVQVFSGTTENGQLLVFEPDSPLENVRFVRIETTALAANLWPAWREITVLGR